MKEPLPKDLNHQSPHWIRDDAIYFMTICTEPRGRNQIYNAMVGPEILKDIGHYHEKGKWFCHLGLLMPDHVHLLLNFPDIPSISSVIGDWKRWLTTRHRIQWQENYFDHRLRREESMGQKADYILHNPVRASLIAEARNWPYIWIGEN